MQRIIVVEQRQKARFQARYTKTPFGRNIERRLPSDVSIDEVLVPDDGVYLTLRRAGHVVKIKCDIEDHFTDGDLDLKADALKRKLGLTAGGPSQAYRANGRWR